MRQLWSQLSLRVQAAIAVVVPCVAVALFSSLYFPGRLNAQAADALVAQSELVGSLAVHSAARTMRLMRDGLATQADLDGVFEGLRASQLTESVAAFPLPRGTRELELQPQVVPFSAGAELPAGRYAMPPPGQCVTLREGALEVRCSAGDLDFEAGVVLRVSLAMLAAQQRRNQLVGLWVLLAAALAGLYLALVLSAAIAEPLGVVSRVARDVAAGDVTVQGVEVAGSTEARSMAASLNDMLGRLKELLSQFTSLTERLTTASRGLMGASTDQQHITAQQAAYVQQIASTFEALSRTAQSIMTSTETVEQAAGRTEAAVGEASSVVQEIVLGVTDIRAQATEVAEAITTLSVDLRQVSRIAQVIKQVADRSDLLALNAALEGTKAGEVGKGFSVVAAEMRKLAESIGQSARDISRIVEAVQRSSDDAVARARQGVAAADKGSAVAERARGAFEQILQLSTGTRQAAQQIAVATRQQRESSELAVHGARSITELVKQGVSATSRTTSIAQDLQAAVDALTVVSQRFKVDPPRPTGDA